MVGMMLMLMMMMISAAGITPSQVTCMGIATQRNTFVTWDRWVVLEW